MKSGISTPARCGSEGPRVGGKFSESEKKGFVRGVNTMVATGQFEDSSDL